MSTHVTSGDCPRCGAEYEVRVAWEPSLPSEDYPVIRLGDVDVLSIDQPLLCGHCGASLPRADAQTLADAIVDRTREEETAARDAADDWRFDEARTR